MKFKFSLFIWCILFNLIPVFLFWICFYLRKFQGHQLKAIWFFHKLKMAHIMALTIGLSFSIFWQVDEPGALPWIAGFNGVFVIMAGAILTWTSFRRILSNARLQEFYLESLAHDEAMKKWEQGFLAAEKEGNLSIYLKKNPPPKKSDSPFPW